MRFDDGAREIKSQARALRLVDRFDGAIEAVEDMGHILRVDAGAFVRDAEDDLLGAGFAADTNFAFGGVFDGVGDEIGKYLPNPCFVGDDNGEYFGEIDVNFTGACLRPEAFRQFGCEILHGNVGRAEA